MNRLGIILLLLSACAFGQMSSTGSITASGSTCATTNACISLTLFNAPNLSTTAASIALSGTFSGTLQFESTTDGINWSAIGGLPVTPGSAMTSATAVGTWNFGIAAQNGLRVRCSAFTSGTITVLIQASAGTGVTSAAGVVALFGSAGSGLKFLGDDGALHTASTGAGTVTAGDGVFDAASPVAGALVANTQTANCIFAGPTSGGAVAPTCRTLVNADVPSGLTITSPTLVTPVLGTPSSGTGTNITGLPLSGVVSPTGAITEIQDGDNALFISSASTTSGRVAAEFGEHTASTSAGTPYELQALTLAGSTATPFNATNSLTGSQILPVASFTPTWNTSGVAIGLQEVITNTAAANVSRVFDIKLGATNFFYLALQSGTPATAATTGVNMVLGGSKPQISAGGTTPYLNLNVITKGTLNTCTFALTTSTFTLALSPVTICTYTLPNTALAWYWSCNGTWSNPAGTTPTIAFGENFAQAPTTASAMGAIYTSNAGAVTQSSNITTASGATNIVTSGTLTPAATLFQANWSGKFTGSATSGTLLLTVSLTGTAATGTLEGGCTIQ